MMCSIPGLPTPGSEVPVLITRVNLNPACGLVELWVNMDDGRKHIYEQMREEIQIPKRTFYGSEGKPGDLCLVCISDTWHRTRIVTIENETYSVFLIDQGQPHTATSEALAWGKSDSFLLPPEIESCILANVLSLDNNWPERATTFLMSLPGKKFKGLVQHVLMSDRIILLDIPMASKHMCKLGVVKKIPVDEFKHLVLKCLRLPKGGVSESFHVADEQNLHASCQLAKQKHYYYPELSADTFESVLVTEVTDPLNIICKLLIFSKAVKILSEQMHQHYEASSDLGEAQPPTSGNPCAAKGTNGRWHRSLLRQNIVDGDGVVEVFHVDEGKTESVPARHIKPLLGKFLRMPVVTYFCSLKGISGREWTEEETDYLKSQLLDKTVVAKFDHYGITQNVYFVTLYGADAACVNSCLVEKMGLIKPPEQDLNVQNEPLPPFLYSPGEEQCIDPQNNVNVEGLPDKTWTSNGHGVVNGTTDYVTTSNSPDLNGDFSTSSSSDVQSPCDDYVFTVGSVVDVKVSCIESLQKFWCQATKNSDSLGRLMQDLQTHYASAQRQPLFESVCVARNPDDDMWYRAKIISSQHSSIVVVRFIDYGHVHKVPLQDVRPIDPAFLQLNAQAFQCCLFNLKNPTDSALTEFQKLVDVGHSSDGGLKCVVKAVTSDEEGLLLNEVDIETASDSVCRLLAEKCAQPEAHEGIPPQVLPDAYNYSTYNIEVGGKEKVWVTSSESVNHFYCQLHRNSPLFDKVTENVTQLLGQPRDSDHPLGLHCICLARYTDNEWYRGEVVEMSPKVKVHFVDYGDTLEVNKNDIRPVPLEASTVRSVSVLAIPLGLFSVPAEVPQEVNQWFADHAIGQSFSISVIEKSEKGKLIVELFEGSLNVNVKVRERMAKMGRHKMTSPLQQPDRQLSKNSKEPMVPNEDSLSKELTNEERELNSVHSENGICSKDELEINSKSTTDTGHVHILDEGRKNTLNVLEHKESVAEAFIQGSHSDPKMTQHPLPSCLEGNVNICMYRRANISQNKTIEVYASCIVGPHFFWCQYTNTKDLDAVSDLAQEAGWAPDAVIPETLAPGSQCLALFSSDNQWYRAQVLKKSDKNVHVLFIDYGNESEVDIENVKSLPQSLLEFAPQAFLCSLNGFDGSKGSWDDKVYDDFYNLLVDKQLEVTVFNVENNLEIAVPQYKVNIECDKVDINGLMQKYWQPENDVVQTETLPQDIKTKGNVKHFDASKGNGNTFNYREPEILTNMTETVYASCIVEPNFFWCQFSDTGDLSTVSKLAQEAGQAQQDMTFPESLGPGSPCLALFTSDNQWYRAQVISSLDGAVSVVFIDYGNESKVEIENLRPLPQSLQEKAPRAFLCRLNGFDESKGSWDEEVYDVFYNLLVDKPLKATVLSLGDHSEITVPQYSVEIECEGEVVNTAMQKYWKPVMEECVIIEGPQTETILRDGDTASNMTHTCVLIDDVSSCVYKEPTISQNKTETVYASCIVEPHFFWCQINNTEDLSTVSQLAQEAGQAQQDVTFLESLGPGSPCLVQFSSDNQWYRAQVIGRGDGKVCVVFIDYGNESEVDIKNVRPLPQSLQKKAPLAFLCCLGGFDESKGSWADDVYDDFYNLLVDKPLKVTVLSTGEHPELAVPRYAVEIECEGTLVNSLMEKYWKGVDTDADLAESFESVDLNETRTINKSVEIENHPTAANEWSEPR
ncbi:tudor domain-containing 6 [Mugil cephalus]|uniref:tudor domain-containing 6 n=1 Tax=Mugil cephalus TaxID=48193 RepID=UPI001FB85432|nr:tudor domain-containing 6 [Mugil cephalus]